ncbi:glycoside hydrolase family 2 [Saccharopolyspora erythraea]|uniref:glycoside hydrolase family 2 protein n=1 Tax=Saccharopolyspora erythraea TaxID=1836 RepID=UPI001BA60301|nr:sugar-binding domain-containing protein [Saccharopolyspora erythraea]QUH02680.1 glycoside hydrolase family 2 [Saccharopolyspora erythraea]
MRPYPSASRRLTVILTAGLALTGFAAPAGADIAWEPEEAPLTTPWTAEVGPGNALPEYPRPQLVRQRWQNLNGTWEYAGGSEPPGTPTEQILVPYPPESALSGIQRHDDHMLYRRTFTVPPEWSGQRVLLHFGAVDQRAEVRVNGTSVAIHEGGYTSFSADVTDALVPGGEQELVVVAQDRNDAAPYPVGKQRNKPGGILYTGASGIWQTVWMEPVPEVHIGKLDVTPDVATATFAVRARTGNSDAQVEVVVSEPGGQEVARQTGAAGGELRVAVPNARLWSPADPFLYDLRVRLLDTGGQVLDEVTSYAGMRSVGLVADEQGRPRIALNGRILFQHGPLDQGYWPDGIYTAPTDEALRFDIEAAQRLGFNMIRKHVKVEPARWYYWADRLGMLVWQDMPSLPIDLADPPGSNPPPSEEAKAHFRTELADMIDQLHSTTSIVAWVPFNEGWGEFDTATVAEQVAQADPTRLVDASSGVNCCYSLPDSGAGHIYDDHTYVGPGKPAVVAPRASVDGEYGGLGLVEQGHLWPGPPQAYEMTESREHLTRRYSEVSTALADVVRASGLSAAVYTQTTDVENEVNGFFTYDRRVLKPDLAIVRDHNLEVIDAGTP